MDWGWDFKCAKVHSWEAQWTQGPCRCTNVVFTQNIDMCCDDEPTTDTSVSDQDVFLIKTIYSLAYNEKPSIKVNDMLRPQF